MKELKGKITLDNLKQMTDVNTYNGAFDAAQILSAAFLTILSDGIVINRVKSPVEGDSDNEDNSELFFNFGFDSSYYKNSKTKLEGRESECEYTTMFTMLWKDLATEQYGEDTCKIFLNGFCLDLDKYYETLMETADKDKDDNYNDDKNYSYLFDLLESFNPLWNEEDYNAGLSADSYDEKFEDSLELIIAILNREITLAESEAQRLKEINDTIEIDSIKNDSILLFERYVPLKGYFSNTSNSTVKYDNGKYFVAVYPKDEVINSDGKIDNENGTDSTVYYVYSIPDSKSSWGWTNKVTQKNKIKLNTIEYLDGFNFVVGDNGAVYAYPDKTTIKDLERYKISNGISKSYDLNDISICRITPTGSNMVLNTIVAVGTNGSIYTQTSSGTFTDTSVAALNTKSWRRNIVFNMTHYNAVSNVVSTIVDGDSEKMYTLFVVGGNNGFIEYTLNGTDWVMDRGVNKNVKDIISVSSGDIYILYEDGTIYQANIIEIINTIIKFKDTVGFGSGVNTLNGVTESSSVTFNKCWTKIDCEETISCFFEGADRQLYLLNKNNDIIYKYIGNQKFDTIKDVSGFAEGVTVKKIKCTGDSYIAVCNKGYSYLSDDMINWTGLCGITNSYDIKDISVSTGNNTCDCINSKGEIYKINIESKSNDIYVSLNLAVNGISSEYIKDYVSKKLVYSANKEVIRCKDLRSALAIAEYYVKQNSFN